MFIYEKRGNCGKIVVFRSMMYSFVFLLIVFMLKKFSIFIFFINVVSVDLLIYTGKIINCYK